MGVSAINVLLGIWLFFSPWVFGAADTASAWNAWIVGAVIAIFAGIRAANPVGPRILSWLNMALAVWVFASPWIFAYTANTGRFVNSLCIGVVIFLVSMSSVGTQSATAMPQHR